MNNHLSQKEIEHYIFYYERGRRPALKILKHLSECKSCYEEVLLMRAINNFEANNLQETLPSKKFIEELNSKLYPSNILGKKKENKSSFQKPWQWGFIPALAAAGVIFVLFAGDFIKIPSQKPLGFVSFHQGNVTINKKSAKYGQIIKLKDIIETGEKSAAVIQLNSSILISMKEKSKLDLSSMKEAENNRKIAEITQKKGIIFYNVIKNKDYTYQINTRDFMARILGTQFIINASLKNSNLKLFKGKIKVTPIKKEKKLLKNAIILKRYQQITAQKGIISRKKRLKSIDFKEFKIFGKIRFLTKNQLEDNEKSVPKEIIQYIIHPPNSKKKKKLTLEEIQKKYGALTKVYTKGNKVYIGYFYIKKGKTFIITQKGKVYLKDVKKIEKCKKIDCL